MKAEAKVPEGDDDGGIDGLALEQVVVVQEQVAQRAVEHTEEMGAQVADIALEVMLARWGRLDRYARQQGWSSGTAPEDALKDPRLMLWWQEWCHLSEVMAQMGPPVEAQ